MIEERRSYEFSNTIKGAAYLLIKAKVRGTILRHHLTSSQWAAVAVEADEIIAAIAEAVEQERRSKIAESRQSETSQLIDQSKNHNDSKAAHKAAELFNTNRTYINDAAKLKTERPDAFEKLKSGAATITQIKREIKEEQCVASCRNKALG